MKVTLKQIAEKTGVSINTVSLALRGMANISEETREKVVRAARELGYQKQLKNPAGRRNLCLVSTGMHLQDSYFYMEFYQLFLSYASAHGYTMLAMEAEFFQNDRAVVREKLERYQRIGFAGSPLHSIAFSERYFAFRQACYAAGVAVRPEDEWLDLLPDRGTAYNEAQILARLAITLLKAFRQRNIRVPEDVALIGVDYNPMGQIIEPRLTSIDVCCRAQAEAAVRRLIECIESGVYRPARILLPTVLRAGDTVCDRRKQNRK